MGKSKLRKKWDKFMDEYGGFVVVFAIAVVFIVMTILLLHYAKSYN